MMKKGFTEQEKKFFSKLQRNDSKVKNIFIAIGLFLFFCVLFELFNGFSIIKNSKSIFHGVIGVIIITALYIFAEGVSVKINSKDNVSHPLYKRAYHLFLLLAVTGLFIFIAIWVLNLLNQ